MSVKPVINEYCRQAQLKELENQRNVSKITLERAIAQTRFILSQWDKDNEGDQS